MGFLSKLFKPKQPKKTPEQEYLITLTEEYVKVEHPSRETEQINLADINEIGIVTTDEGPYLPDVWMVLMGEKSGCSLPQGAPKFDDVYDIVSKFEGFDYDEVINAMGSADNASFTIWKKEK